MRLTKKNYFSPEANMAYMSVSQFKAFEKCQASALAELKGEYKREKTIALMVGSYVDAYFDGTLKEFCEENPEIFKRDGTLKAEYIQANEIIRRIERDKFFMQHLKGRKQAIRTGTIAGVPVKIKTDFLHRDKIVDMKIVKDFENVWDSEKGSLPWFEFWGYDIQGGVYQEVMRQNIGKQLPFRLAAATKEKTTDIDVLNIGQQYLDISLAHFKEKAPLYDAIKKGIIEPERCGNCDYCKQTKVLTEPTEADLFYFN